MKRINQLLIQTLTAAIVMISANQGRSATLGQKQDHQIDSSDVTELNMSLCLCAPDSNTGCGNTCCNNSGCHCG